MARERTFVLLKPDAVQRGLVGTILERFERRGLKIIGLKLTSVPRARAEEYYVEHRGKPFFEGLMQYIGSGPVIAVALEGDNAVATVRAMIGATDPATAAAGTIRADFGLSIGKNLIHASDSRKSADREIAIFFKAGELKDYERADEKWLFD